MSSLLNYLDNLVSAGFSTVGAFIPIFVLMVVHYFFRKKSYSYRIKRVDQMIEMNKKMADMMKDILNHMYRAFGTKDFNGFVTKIRQDKNVSPAKFQELITLADKHLTDQVKYRDSANKLNTEKSYLEGYDFKTYLGNILDRRFPDEIRDKKSKD